MDLLPLTLLALLEGFTEFLPISSTAHLILLSRILDLPSENFTTSFTIAIQTAAILSVLTLYYKTLKKHPQLVLKILIGFAPAAAIGIALYPFITETLFNSMPVIAGAMGVGGIILIFAEKYFEGHKAHITELSKITYKKALAVGVIQSFSLIPGTSRAASSIIGGLLLGLDRKTAVEFSFLLALPTIGSATALDLVVHAPDFTKAEFTAIAIGGIITYAVALLTMKYFLKFLNKTTLTAFGIYRIILALIMLFFFL